jgi:hypothetical protein
VSSSQPASDDQQLGDIEARLAALERAVATLTAAVDAASRLRISSLRLDPDIRVAGGKKVRRILEKGGLVQGYPELPTGD